MSILGYMALFCLAVISVFHSVNQLRKPRANGELIILNEELPPALKKQLLTLSQTANIHISIIAKDIMTRAKRQGISPIDSTKLLLEKLSRTFVPLDSKEREYRKKMLELCYQTRKIEELFSEHKNISRLYRDIGELGKSAQDILDFLKENIKEAEDQDGKKLLDAVTGIKTMALSLLDKKKAERYDEISACINGMISTIDSLFQPL